MSGCFPPAGLGKPDAGLQVFIANRPPLDDYRQLAAVRPVVAGEIARIAAETGNHWRKIFNVYAKLVYAWQPAGFARWQDFRDQALLQAGSDEALLFTPPDLTGGSPALRLLLGKGYAQALGMTAQLEWLDQDFARHRPSGVLLCPYFDYRQLSDEKIRRLVGYIRG